ncbi:MAG: FAD-dependent monooxygenase [Ardenticatenaceae bacterium]|nr:FAD-dependent monooxygenase [Ardenticatenaceae bacterium]
MRDFDVIIVGARLAGATLAGFLSRAGKEVLLVDRVKFPRDTVSCAVAYAKAVALWDAIGAGEKIDAIGAPPIRRVRKVAPHTTIAGYLLPYGGRDYGYGLRRITLDEVLLRHVATMPGITVRERFSVTDLLEENGRVIGVAGKDLGSGAVEQFRTPLVAGADGIHSFVARRVGADIYYSHPPEQCHYYAFYHNFEPVAEPELFIHQDSPDQSVLVFEVNGDDEGDLIAVSWMPAARRFETVREDIETAYVNAWHSIPELAERGRNATRATPILGRAPTDTYYRKPYGPGWALVGDAAYYTDPNGGRGFYDALRGAELLAHAIEQIARGRPWAEAMRVYHYARDYEFEPSYRFVRSMSTRAPERPPMEVKLFALAAEDPAFADCLLSVNHGVGVERFAGAPSLPFTGPGDTAVFDRHATERRLNDEVTAL